jgi:cAMP-dependent protein kinase regulator
MAGYDRALYQSYLSTVPMFARCSPEQLDRIADSGTALSTKQGGDIVREGEPGDDFFVITSGNARVVRHGAEVGHLGAGDYFGELALFDPLPRNATVTATSDVVSVVALSRNSFGKVLDEVPAIRDALLHGMAHRLHELDAKA